MSQYHTAVMEEEVLRFLAPEYGKIVVDATLGGGGHARALYEKGATIVGIDQDEEALAESIRVFHASGVIIREQKKGYFAGERIWLIQDNFRNLQDALSEISISTIDGILFDLGVSSHQFDSESRGFTYRYNGPFDLRMNPHTGVPAWEIIKNYDEKELYELIARYGEEELAGPIAHALVVARQVKDICTSGDVVQVINKLVAMPMRAQVLSRVFQAFRIVVNDELGALREGIEQAISLLSLNGTIVVISYHSLEDRIVKLRMLGKDLYIEHKKPFTAQNEEILQNIRARSARMRIAKKRNI